MVQVNYIGHLLNWKCLFHIISLGCDGDGTSTPGGGGGGASSFIQLNDVPSSYSGQHGKFLSPNAAEDALEYVDAPSQPDTVSETDAAAGTSETVKSWTAKLVRLAINAVVPTWARISNNTAIPAEKLTNIDLSGQIEYDLGQSWHGGSR